MENIRKRDIGNKRDPLLWNKVFASAVVPLLIITVARELSFILYKSEQFYNYYDPVYSIAPVEDNNEESISPQEIMLQEVLQSLSQGNAENGARVFKRCASCHSVSNTNTSGPYLNDLFGRKQGSIKGFKYSEALSTEKIWTKEEFTKFIMSPKKYAPGTLMSFAGLKKAQDIIDIIAFLDQESR